MNLDELKPSWHQYTASVADREKRTTEELDELLPPPKSSFFTTRSFFLLKNAAMYTFIILSCGGC